MIIRRLQILFVVAWLANLPVGTALFAKGSSILKTQDELSEVMRVIEEHLPGVTESEIVAAALSGLKGHFSGRFLIADPDQTPDEDESSLQLEVVKERYALARLVGISDAGDSFTKAWSELDPGLEIEGLVLDLRESSGNDYRSAVALVDLISDSSGPLLEIDGVDLPSMSKGRLVNVPVVALIGSETQGAGEAVAAAIRQQRIGLLVGGKTSGLVSASKAITLSSGIVVSLSEGIVKTAAGDSLSNDGVSPDIVIEEGSDRIESEDLGGDPVMAAALDFLTGLSVLKNAQLKGLGR
jgi:hypothetical protein